MNSTEPYDEDEKNRNGSMTWKLYIALFTRDCNEVIHNINLFSVPKVAQKHIFHGNY